MKMDVFKFINTREVWLIFEIQFYLFPKLIFWCGREGEGERFFRVWQMTLFNNWVFSLPAFSFFWVKKMSSLSYFTTRYLIIIVCAIFLLIGF